MYGWKNTSAEGPRAEGIVGKDKVAKGLACLLQTGMTVR